MPSQIDSRPKILIVDDDPVFALLASETLEQAGFCAIIASTAQKALAAFDAATPALVMLDVELPGSNGFETCARIRTMSGCLDLPIIMVTGHEDTESIARAYQVGASDFINKPLLWPTLPHRVGFMLRARDNIRELRVSEQKNRALLQALPDSIYIIDDSGTVLEFITGDDNGKPLGVVGARLENIVPADVAAAIRKSMRRRILDHDGSTHEFALGDAGAQRYLEARVRPQADATFLIVTRDVTERRSAEARIENLAYYDTLTGMPNRQLFLREMDRAMRKPGDSKRCMALFYLDLDRFKRINDNLGRAVGDALLQKVAQRLQQCIGNTEQIGQALVARLGGDEFGIMLADVAEESRAASIAKHIGQILGEPFDCGGHRFVVTPSIGIALYPRDAVDGEDLLVKADMAMYQRKRKVETRMHFTENQWLSGRLAALSLKMICGAPSTRAIFNSTINPK